MFILINIGGSFDLNKGIFSNKKVILIDKYRPINHNNIISGSNVIIIDEDDKKINYLFE